MGRLPEQLPPDFDGFFQNSLKFYYEAATVITANRTIQFFKYILVGVLLVLIAPRLLERPMTPIRYAGLALVGGAIYWLLTNERFAAKKFKVSVDQIRVRALNELVRFLHPGLHFHMKAPQMDPYVRQMFPGKLDYIREAGCISGIVDDRLVCSVHVDAGYYKKETRTVNGKKQTVQVPVNVFNGLFIAMDFPRRFDGWVTLQRDKLEKSLGWLGTELQQAADKNVVRLENGPFETVFKVRASDPVVAHYVLSSSFMDRLLNLDSRFHKFPFTMAFQESTLFLALPFKPPLFAAMGEAEDWRESAKVDAEAVLLMLDIFEELKIGQDLWLSSESA